MSISSFVIPAQAGIHIRCLHGAIAPSENMDPRLRGDDVELCRYV